MPSDPKALMLLAARANSITGAGVQPWHLKASFQLFDWDGKPTNQGTYEEFWASPTKRKRIFTSTTFTQTEFTTEKGILRSGLNAPPPAPLAQIVNQLIDPMQLDEEKVQHLTVALKENKTKVQTLECLGITGSDRDDSPRYIVGDVFCLDDKIPLLRISTRSGPMAAQVLRNNTVRFQGHYLPQDIQSLAPGPPDGKPRPTFKLHLDSVEVLKTVDEADFAPSADAVPPPRRIELSADVASKQLLNHPKPAYPPIAKAACVSGKVVLEVVIASNGTIESARVISGPPMLQEAAIDSVRKWTYKPFLANGEAVEVGTTATVPFVLPIGAGPGGPCG
jgi:TonB family protein